MYIQGLLITYEQCHYQTFVKRSLPSSSTMVTVTVLLSATTMSRGFVGCIISWNVSFPSTMVSPKMSMAATQTPWPCVVVDGITTSLVSSVKSAEPEVHIQKQDKPCSTYVLLCTWLLHVSFTRFVIVCIGRAKLTAPPKLLTGHELQI